MSQLAATFACLIGAHGASAGESFTLTATARDLDRYYPTYLANGFWSAASSPGGSAATAAQMAGVMDYTRDDVSRPAAIPSWTEIDYFDGRGWLNDQPVAALTHAGYRQSLHMHDGLLQTRYRWRDTGRDSDVAAETFVSQRDGHLGVQTLTVVPHFDGRVRLRFTLRLPAAPHRLALATLTAAEFDSASQAAHRPEQASGGERGGIWYAGEVRVEESAGDAPRALLWMRTRAIGGRAIDMATAIGLPAGLSVIDRRVTHTPEGVALEVEADVVRGHAYRFTKFVATAADGWRDDSQRTAASLAAAARTRGTESLRARHIAAWREMWRADVRVGGNERLQRTLHSDLFYLLENTASHANWAAAAGGFSTLYFGHVFWDNDLWVFPALLPLHPERAESLIAFRQRTLPQARERARAHGFAGAMYPWESDPWTGEDVTPRFALENADREIHVDAAVAIAQWQYYLATGDRDWLRMKAYPVIRAVADFWTSRMTRKGSSPHQSLLDVTSPEEDYVHVDNEIYTNEAAHHSLDIAMAAAQVLGLPADPLWREAADELLLPSREVDGIVHDFDPSTPHDKTTSWMATSVPMLSIPALDFMAPAAALERLFRHSVEAIAPIRPRANQMVLVMLAIQAADVGHVDYFDDLVGAGGDRAGTARGDGPDAFLKPPFNVRSETPQNDSTYLLATSGGFVQAFLYGLTGLRLDHTGLVRRFAPTLPRGLSYLEIHRLTIRGRQLDARVTRDRSGRAVLSLKGSSDHD